jgi:hypothetical protein
MQLSSGSAGLGRRKAPLTELSIRTTIAYNAIAVCMIMLQRTSVVHEQRALASDQALTWNWIRLEKKRRSAAREFVCGAVNKWAYDRLRASPPHEKELICV